MKRSFFNVVAFAAVLASLTGCERLLRRSPQSERNEAHYRAGMADVAAGRMDKAIAQFDKALAGNPANASARFQLACLQHDKKKDYLAALCNYIEYLRLDPTGNKANLCRERMSLCERDLAQALARRYNIASSATLADDNAKLKDELAKTETVRDDLDKQVRKLQLDLAAMARENERLRRMAKSIGEEPGERTRPNPPAAYAKKESARDLLDNDKESETALNKAKFDRDVKELEDEERQERTATPFAPTQRVAAQPAKKSAKDAAREARPKFYVVQDGDTLYKIAIRFYGTRKAWKSIREANKGVVSMDGRLRRGVRLVLP